MDAPLHKADLKTYIFQAMHENINIFSSAFLFQKFSMVFLIFWDALQPKASKY